MTTKHETIELLDNLIEAMKELDRMWDEVEDWSEKNLDPVLDKAA